MTPNHHLRGEGCSICGGKYKFTKDDFIRNAIMIHNNKYDYSKVNYINNNTKVEIICPKHGSFFQKPRHHMNYEGCPKCNSSHGEEKIRNWLIDNNVEFEEQKRFEDCRNQKPLPFDFYLPKQNVCIEFNGEQHYRNIDYWDKNNEFDVRKIRDCIKEKYCKDNNIKLYIIKYNEDINEKLNELKEILWKM